MTPSDIIGNAIQAVLNNVHTATIGIVQAFDSTTGKAAIQPAINKQFSEGPEPMPVLYNVPIIFPRGQGFSLSFPVVQGDYVLVVFCERSIDLWKSVGGQVNPNDYRKFDLSDGIAIPGILPFNSPQTPIDGFTIEYAGSKIQILPSGDVKILTSGTIAIGSAVVELLQKISDTLAGIASITTTVTVPSVPFGPVPFPIDNAATFTALQAQIDSIKGTLP